MKYIDALNLAKKIMTKRPNYVLAGSVALILQGTIPERDIHDLDFACVKEEFTFMKELGFYGGGTGVINDDYSIVTNDENTCYKVTADNGHYYDVFVFDESSKLDYTEINGIKVQSSEQIMKYKRQFNREKDRRDIQAWEPFGGVNPNIDYDDIPF